MSAKKKSDDIMNDSTSLMKQMSSPYDHVVLQLTANIT